MRGRVSGERDRDSPVRGGPGLLARLSGILGLRPPRKKQPTKLDRRRYGPGISLGKSPTVRDIEKLARKAGFRALLNLNTEGEPGEILSPNVEATWAHTFEMQHERVSIDLEALRPERVDRFLETLRTIAKPVYVHSLQGRRAAALLTVHLALECKISGSDALVRAKTLGLDCALERLQSFTVSEVDRRTHPGGQARAVQRARATAASTDEMGGDGAATGSARVAREAC
jgi:protein tyrosine phosphatase (PTP) superfamily phosphohydrolase (DUF442 family)